MILKSQTSLSSKSLFFALSLVAKKTIRIHGLSCPDLHAGWQAIIGAKLFYAALAWFRYTPSHRGIVIILDWKIHCGDIWHYRL